MPSVESCFLRAMLGVSIVAWLALVLAELGFFHVELLLALVAAAGLAGALGRYLLGRPEKQGVHPRGLKATVGFAALLPLVAVLYVPPYEAVVGGGDGSVYISFGRQVAETGRLEFEDDLVSRLPAGVRREVFRNRSPRLDVSGEHPRFLGGLRIPDIEEPSVTAGFSPLFPVLTALFHEVASLSGAFFVSPVFATLSMGALFLVAAHVGGPWTAGLTTILMLGLLPQIWFARFPAPETVAQCLVMSGLLAWLVALRDDAPRWALAAGWFLGVACFAKVDLNVLLSVSLGVFCAWWCFARPAHRPVHLACLLISFGVLFLHNVVHYLVFASHYRPYVENLLRTSVLSQVPWPAGGTGVAAALLLLGALAGAGFVLAARYPSHRRRACGFVLAALLAVYAINYAARSEGMLGETIEWLSWYVSWPVLLLAVPGVTALIGVGGVLRARSASGPALLLAVFAVVCLHYLYDPLESGVQVWSMRRFVPVVLPLLMLIAALGVAAGLRRVPAGYRAGVAAVVVLVLADLVARPSLAVVRQPLWKGAVAETERVAGLFPDDAVVLTTRELGGSHIPTALAYLHGVDTVLVHPGDPRSPRMGEAIDIWLALGRPVFFVFGDLDYFSFFAPQLALAYVDRTNFDVLLPERTRSRAPRDAVRGSVRLHVFRVRRGDAARTAADVGNPAEDVLFSLRGFHSPERHAADDATFRWTGPEAALTLPAAGRVELTVAGVRPPGVPPAEVSVRLGGRLVVDRRILDGGLETLLLDAPAEPGPVDLELESTVFEPRKLGISDDPRALGVRVYGVEFGVSGSPQALPDDGEGDLRSGERRSSGRWIASAARGR